MSKQTKTCRYCGSDKVVKWQGYYFCNDCKALLDEVPPEQPALATQGRAFDFLCK